MQGISIVTYNENQSTITPVKELYPGDKHFKFNDGLIEWPRAGICIDETCPADMARMIQTCIGKGWVKPVAYVPERVIVWETLKE